MNKETINNVATIRVKETAKLEGTNIYIAFVTFTDNNGANHSRAMYLRAVDSFFILTEGEKVVDVELLYRDEESIAAYDVIVTTKK